MLDAHPLKDVPLFDPSGDLRFDILRTFVGRIGGELSADGNRLGPGHEGNNQEKQQHQRDGKARRKSKAFGDLDRFPGLKLCRGRKVVDRDLIQTGVPSNE